MRSLIGAGAFIKKSGLRWRGGIGIERIDGFLGVPELDRRGRERLKQLLAHSSIGVIVLDGLQHLVSISVATQSALRLSCPVQRVLAEQRVVLRLDEPPETLRGSVL